MQPIIYTKVQLRNPFKCLSLPLIASLYAKGFRYYNTIIKKGLIALPFRILHRIMYSLNLKNYGKFIFHNNETDHEISFNARNTQFSSIYLPQYRQGYKAETLAFLDAIIGEDIFYDVGSNWGHFSLHIASNKNFNGKIYAFEPMPDTFNDLKEIVTQAELGSRIECHKLALSDSNAAGFMDIPDGISSGNATVSSNTQGIGIIQKKLDELELPPPTIMKVDAEGNEDKIFGGGRNTLSEHKPIIIFESWRNLNNPEATLKPLTILEELGYVFFEPVILLKSDNNLYTVGYDQYHNLDLPDQVDLGLLEFAIKQRYSLSEHFNIIACHKDKTDRLKNIFNQKTK